VVRVGNHPRSNGGLRQRLQQHYSGRKNSSVFRKLLGGAILRSNNPSDPCLQPGPGQGHWEHHHAPKCARCRPIEKKVSHYVSTRMRFRCVSIPDRAERNRLERALIATLAACTICRPSPDWLGLHAYLVAVRASGLWNSQFTDGIPLALKELERFKVLTKFSFPQFGTCTPREDPL
jgi:hypothetical protein